MDVSIKGLFDLSGRVALVTGGATGLGFEMAMGLAEAGARVAIASRRQELCEAKAAEIARATGAQTRGLRMDAAKQEEAWAAVDAVVKAWGRLDVLVNNAGGSSPGDTLDMKAADWHAGMDANLSGAFYCAQAAGKHMIPAKRGSIINVGSIWAAHGVDGRLYLDDPKAGEPPERILYTAAKGGIVNMTRGLAGAWGRHGIRVNCLSPGFFPVERMSAQLGKKLDTVVERWSDRTPLGRCGEPGDIKGVAVFLASDASRYVSGQEILVDGGWSIW
jgi:NAD(P)-dependent dehydrogenase (short-subunit alcohol dehydrogenase family)